MAVFKKFDSTKISVPWIGSLFGINASNKKVEWYIVNGEITSDDVSKINSLNNYTILMIKNTKDQNCETIRKITNPNVKFSVVGGLNYINKKKYNDSDYILRTIHSPQILSKIIEYFEKIERNIRYTWTDTQKSMYVYKTLVEQLHYKYDTESDYENHRDVVRSLEGLLYSKLVCSGFALVFKEAMDRIGIPCDYQNQQHHHSWNVLELDGKKIGVDITWDCNNKGKDNWCEFDYFGNEKFYQNEHHDISKETEEIKYDLGSIQEQDMLKNYSVIENNGNVIKKKMNKTTDILNTTVYYFCASKNEIESTYFISYNDSNHFLSFDKNINIEEELRVKTIYQLCKEALVMSKNSETIKNTREYIRSDYSKFFIRNTNNKKNDINEYCYFDIVNDGNDKIVRRGIILSEMDLLNAQNNEVANILLSKDRLRRKILFYNGYVGYVHLNQRYYNPDFEETLGIKNRK